MTVPPRLAKCYLRTSPFLCCCVESYSLNKVEVESSTKNKQTKKCSASQKQRKEKQKQNKNNRLESSFFFLYGLLRAQKFFIFFQSMAYNPWIYGHNNLKEQKKIFVQKDFSVITRPCTCFLLSCTNMAAMTLPIWQL